MAAKTPKNIARNSYEFHVEVFPLDRRGANIRRGRKEAARDAEEAGVSVAATLAEYDRLTLGRAGKKPAMRRRRGDLGAKERERKQARLRKSGTIILIY